MALDKLTLLDETVVNSTATSTSNTIFTNRFITYKNKIINGNFDFWQRGTSLGSGTGVRFLADRWLNESDGSTYTVSQQSFTLGQTSVPNEPSFFHRTVVTSVAGAGNRAFFYQRIESVRTLAGKTATLSFWAKADSNKNIAIEFNQSFGTVITGGSSGLLGIGVTTCSLTSSWQKFTVIVNIPSIVGKTLGTSGNDFLSFTFWFDAGSSFNSRTNSLGQQSGTFDIAQVQLEEGSVATPFEVRPQGLELSLCQRYYQTIFILPGGGAQYFAVGAFGTTNVNFIKQFSNLRTSPSSTTLINNSNIETYQSTGWTASVLSVGNYGTGPTFEIPVTVSSDSSGAGRLVRKTTPGDVIAIVSAEL